MRAGLLRERVTLVSNGDGVPDGRGGFRPGPETTQTVWGRVQSLKGSEQLRLGAILTGQVYVITLRLPLEVSETMRIRWQDKTMSVQSLVREERSREVTLTCVDDGK